MDLIRIGYRNWCYIEQEIRGQDGTYGIGIGISVASDSCGKRRDMKFHTNSTLKLYGINSQVDIKCYFQEILRLY